MSATLHVGNIGSAIQITIVDQDDVIVDLTGATVLEIIALAPDGARKVWTCTVLGLATAGVIQYVTTLSTDLHVAGLWKLQAHIDLPSGEWRGGILLELVETNL